MANRKSRPRQIAVLGGGIGSLSAVFELTSVEDWQSQFDITVYQLGWRLGGKGASGRDRDKGCRSEEHGLHIWLGFYDNAIDLVQRCYKALDPGKGHRFTKFEDAFSGFDSVMLMENDPDWEPHRYSFPSNIRKSGKDVDGYQPTVWNFFSKLILYTESYVRQTIPVDNNLDPVIIVNDYEPLSDDLEYDDRDQELVNSLPERLDSAIPDWRSKDTVFSVFAGIVRQNPTLPSNTTLDLIHDLAVATSQRASNWNRETPWLIAEIAVAIMRGMIHNGVFLHGFQVIENLEWSAWLRSNGASHEALRIAPVRALYDLVFGYEKGDGSKCFVAAGTGMRALFRLLFDYKGHMFYRPRAGFGEAVFTPLYLVLKDRGVKFEFFHRVTKLVPSHDQQAIERIEIDRQVELKRCTYDPVTPYKDLLCWPARPDYSQIKPREDGSFPDPGQLESSGGIEKIESLCLHRGVGGPNGFDDIILGIPISVLRYITKDFSGREWKEMINKVETVATISAQIWVKRDGLQSDADNVLLGAYADLFDTTWDAKEILSKECWDYNGPRALYYMCGAYPDLASKIAASRLDNAHEKLRVWLTDHGRRIWKDRGADRTTQFPFDALYCPQGGSKDERLAWQYAKINSDPSNLYVQSTPGTSRFRISATAAPFENLYLAGDWVKTGLDAGCMEAAVMAGLGAARGISGRNIFISGEKDMVGGGLFGKNSPFGCALCDPASDFKGRIEAQTLILSDVPIENVVRMLPKKMGMRLVPVNDADSDVHPVGLMFARYSGVRPALLPPLLSLSYNEFAVIVPNVTIDDPNEKNPELFSILPYLRLNEELPAWGGRYILGLNKTVAGVHINSTSASVTEGAKGNVEISLDFKLDGNEGLITEFPNLDKLRRLMEQPVVVQGGFPKPRIFEMDFMMDKAKYTPFSGRVEIMSGNGFNLPAKTYTVSSITHAIFGGFTMKGAWRLRGKFVHSGKKPVTESKKIFSAIRFNLPRYFQL